MSFILPKGKPNGDGDLCADLCSAPARGIARGTPTSLAGPSTARRTSRPLWRPSQLLRPANGGGQGGHVCRHTVRGSEVGSLDCWLGDFETLVLAGKLFPASKPLLQTALIRRLFFSLKPNRVPGVHFGSHNSLPTPHPVQRHEASTRQEICLDFFGGAKLV